MGHGENVDRVHTYLLTMWLNQVECSPYHATYSNTNELSWYGTCSWLWSPSWYPPPGLISWIIDPRKRTVHRFGVALKAQTTSVGPWDDRPFLKNGRWLCHCNNLYHLIILFEMTPHMTYFDYTLPLTMYNFIKKWSSKSSFSSVFLQSSIDCYCYCFSSDLAAVSCFRPGLSELTMVKLSKNQTDLILWLTTF